MRLRRYRLESAREDVLRLAGLRRPQREALDRVHELLLTLDNDIPQLPQERLIQQCRDLGLQVPTSPPRLELVLATGVGKTLLMGALVSYLFRAGQSRNFLILASRKTILEKFERETQKGSPKYFFIDSGLVPDPQLCYRSNVEAFVPAGVGGPNVFVLSPQSISGDDRRVARPSEFRGFSLLEYLRGLDDLIVLVDEAHHLARVGDEETRVWTQGVRDLGARISFGFTATPRKEPGVNILYTYDLATCLREGLYTKNVSLIVKQRSDARVADADWDHSTIDFALQRLDRKRTALKLFAEDDPGFSYVEPVLLICAENTAHAEEIGKWLTERRGIGAEEILVTHSQKSKSEEDIARLVGIDSPANKVRVVINVFELTEGWDVTNVYVIAPLRAMGTFQGAVQSMGRGLRLPAGYRVGDADIDSLDVLCFGRESLEEILNKAIDSFGEAGEASTPIAVKSADAAASEAPVATKSTTVAARFPVKIAIPQVRRVPGEPVLDFDVATMRKLIERGAVQFDLTKAQVVGTAEAVRYGLELVVRLASDRIIADLAYLSDPLHGDAVEQLVRRFLRDLGASPDQPLAVDPNEVGLLVEEEIDKLYKRQPVKFEVTGSSHELVASDFEWRVTEEYTGPLERVPVSAWE